MKDLKITTTGDLDFTVGGNKDLQFETDTKEVIAQRLRIALRSFKNDWFINLADGLPYFDDILVKNASIATIQALIKSTILNVEGVNSLVDFQMNYDISTRKFTIDFQVLTAFGTLPLVVNIL